MDNGHRVEIDLATHPHLDHGYAVTSHSSQGQTAERVLVHVDTELGAKDLLNNRMAYVAVSRTAHDAQLLSNDRDKLSKALGHDVSHQSAHVSEIAPARSIQPKNEPEHEHSMGTEWAYKQKPAMVPPRIRSVGFMREKLRCRLGSHEPLCD